MVRKNQYRNELISEIKTLAQSNGLNTVFTTFLEITATSIAAQMDPQNAEEREKRYQEIAYKMTPEMLSSYAELPLMRQQILKLLYVDELTVGEIAKRLNCSAQYVSDQKQKGLKHLRKKMSEGGDENG